ncbi:hypothetical protein [Actinokineospora sp.]|uniref:hypothetical protein n=1 Tax=Actinokineospora sp. TaxID=1872133 RepID=UPI003D6C526B
MPNRFPRRSFLSWSVAAAALPMVMTGASPAFAAGAVVDDRLAAGTGWRDFLGALDLVWQSVPTSFYQGPFLGNGGMGMSVYLRSGANRLAFVLGDSRVRDHQTALTPRGKPTGTPGEWCRRAFHVESGGEGPVVDVAGVVGLDVLHA